MPKCYCCESEGKFSIELAYDPSEETPRFYLPNQNFRTPEFGDPGFLASLRSNLIHEVFFCERCMRKIEDNFRATVAYLKSEGFAY